MDDNQAQRQKDRAARKADRTAAKRQRWAAIKADLIAIGLTPSQARDVKEGIAAPAELLAGLPERIVEHHLASVRARAGRLRVGLWGSLDAQAKAVLLDLTWRLRDGQTLQAAWADVAAGHAGRLLASDSLYPADMTTVPKARRVMAAALVAWPGYVVAVIDPLARRLDKNVGGVGVAASTG